MRTENTVKDELVIARNKVILLENELRAIERDLAFQDYKVRIGSVVVSDGQEFMVTGVRYKWHNSLPSLMGRRKLMGGTWGQQEKHIYGEWELKDG